MTPREVLLAAVRFQNPPYTPWAIEFTATPAAALERHFGGRDVSDCLHDHVVTFRAPTRENFRPVEPGKFLDLYGTLWDRTIDADIGTPCRHALPAPTLKGFRFPPCRGNEETVRKKLARYPDRAVRFSLGFALFERAWALRGMEALLMDFVERPAFAHELLDAIVAHDMELLEWARPFKPDIVHFGDDWGQQQGMLMGPALWRRFLKPRLAEQYAAVHDIGKKVFIHSCGKVIEIFPDLIEIGLDCFNPFQPEVIDVYAAKREFGDQLSFFGGVSTQHLLPYGTPAQVKAEARRLMREVGRNGGYILAPAHSIPKDAPPENMMALIEAVNEQM